MVDKIEENPLNENLNVIIKKVNELVDIANKPAPKAAPAAKAAPKKTVKK